MPEIGQGRNLFDDTPVNGQIEKGITSNWAFDEDATLKALIEATLPWWITIDVIPTPKSNTNFGEITLNGNYYHGLARGLGGHLNDEITWDIVLAAGTWTLELTYRKGPAQGIASLQFDTVQKGLVDSYATDDSFAERISFAGITLPTTKKIELKLKITGTNPSCGGYWFNFDGIYLIRTA